MDYTGLKKEELVAKLEEQRHLAAAVEAKDKEIAKLRTETAQSIELLKKDYRDLKSHMAEEIAKKVATIAELEDTIKNFPDIQKLEEAIKLLEEQNKKIVKFSNQHINVFRNTLKSLQGTLDNAIELEDIIVNGVKEN
jgi:uncharacterized Zn finger protein